MYRDAKRLAAGMRRARQMIEISAQIDRLEPGDLVKLDSGYRHCATAIARALYCPADGTGNSQIFTHKLAEHCRNKADQFEFGTKIESLIDEDYLIAFAPIGIRIRITATADLSGYDNSHRPADFQVMTNSFKEFMPHAADCSAPLYKTCLRPMTPQGAPYIGFTQYDNLLVNAGHGHMGWTMACGSAKLAADLIAGHQPEIHGGDFSPI